MSLKSNHPRTSVAIFFFPISTSWHFVLFVNYFLSDFSDIVRIESTNDISTRDWSERREFKKERKKLVHMLRTQHNKIWTRRKSKPMF